MISIMYDAHRDYSRVEPKGWPRGVGAYPDTTVHLSKTRRIDWLNVDLHEFAHVNQLHRGYLSYPMYEKHKLFIEAEASAISVLWVAPEHFCKAVQYRLECLDDYCLTFGIEPPPSFGSLAAYFKHHIRRIERRWQAYAESKCNVSGLAAL